MVILPTILSACVERSKIANQPEALSDWVLALRERFADQGKILICLEQSRGALMHFLMGYDCFELYPINPKQLDSYRKAFRPSGAKNDPTDGELLCKYVSLHHQELRPWRPDDEQTRKRRSRLTQWAPRYSQTKYSRSQP
jgi:transposase